MTKDELRKAAAVMLAAAEGKTIQYKDNSKWVTKPTNEMKFNWEMNEYRIKPNTIKYRLALCLQPESMKHIIVCFENEEHLRTYNNYYGDNFIRFLTDWIEVEIDNE